MRVTVPKESAEGERRVAAVPETVRLLTDAGWAVEIERGAGEAAFVPDDAYTRAGAHVVDDLATSLRQADVVLSVQPLPIATLGALSAGSAVVSLLAPDTHREHIRICRDRNLVAFALELVPRISRAQPMDVLSSQAMVAGYRGALIAAERLPGFFPLAMTAAGTAAPAAVLVLGTGVAGLQAIATARRLGAVTSGHDVRASSADEVASLGATFLPLAADGPVGREGVGGYARVGSEAFLAAQRRLLHDPVGRADVVITTAAVPGRRAPLLIPTGMVEQMRPGSVIVDLAAETGGNCELTRIGETVEHHGVVVVGPRNAPSEVPRQASEWFARNVANLLLLMTTRGRFQPDFADEIVAGCCVTRGGAVVSAVARAALGEVGSAREDSVAAAPVAAGPVAAGPVGTPAPRSRARRGTVPEVAELLATSRTVVLVPGYGLAAARAQHALRALADAMDDRGADVTYAIHPVAGRFPGHLTSTLAEADVPYPSLLGVEQANAALPAADVVLVVGANDVVNPVARTSARSPLAGLPILDVAAARQVVFLKRSGRPGFAGLDNPLLSDERTVLLAGDLGETLVALVAALTAVRSA